MARILNTYPWQIYTWQRLTLLWLSGALVLGLVGMAPQQDIQAAKKKKDNGAAADAELQKGLEPLNKSLSDMLIKIQGRMLFSPKEAGALADIKYKLFDLMKDNGKNPLLVKPLYQASIIYIKREQYEDAYELLSYLSNTFPDNPYAMRAKNQVLALKKRLGEDYFPPDLTASADNSGATSPSAGSTTSASTPKK